MGAKDKQNIIIVIVVNCQIIKITKDKIHSNGENHKGGINNLVRSTLVET